MKTLDRYVISAFLKNYLISFLVLIGMFIVLDMVFKFDDLVAAPNTQAGDAIGILTLLRALASFYFYKTFLFFLYLGPVIPGVAASFTLLRLTRNNELTAIMAAGVPLLRVAAPIVVIAVILSGLGALDQELVIPNIIPELMTKHSQIVGGPPTAKTVPPMRDSDNRVLMAARYYAPADNSPATMDLLDVVYRDDKLRPIAHLYADRAVWNPDTQLWHLTNGFIVQGLLPEERPTQPQPVSTLKTSITPDEIALFRSGDYVDLLSTARIRQLLERTETYGSIDLLHVMHSRYAQLLLNIILLLLAIPSVLTRDTSKLRTATAQALLLTGACLGTVFLSHNLAGQIPPNPAWSNTWPALMAWLPVFIFGPLSVYLLDRVKS